MDLRTGVCDIPAQDIMSRDSVPVAVDAVLLYRVTDPMLAVCADGDYNLSTKYKAQAVIRQQSVSRGGESESSFCNKPSRVLSGV